jgi:hypothetical protein
MSGRRCFVKEFRCETAGGGAATTRKHKQSGAKRYGEADSGLVHPVAHANSVATVS